MEGVCSGLMIIVFSGPFLYFGLLFVAKTRDLLRRGVRTDATIVDFEKDENSESDYPAPTVEFVDQLGATHRVTLNLSYGKEWRREDTKTIIYDTNNPNYIIGYTFAEVWLVPLAVVIWADWVLVWHRRLDIVIRNPLRHNAE